jgi:hypothetical protein
MHAERSQCHKVGTVISLGENNENHCEMAGLKVHKLSLSYQLRKSSR